jgi:glutamate carboxypeptidase
VILTGDEERTGTRSSAPRADLVELAKESDAALSFEGTGPRGEASITRRSAGGWTLTVRAKPGHSGGVFSPVAGYGAVFEAARILNAFREQLVEPNLTFNPGVAVGGTQVDYSDATATGNAFGKTNVIAKDFVARGDLRYLTPEQGDKTKARMREIVAASLPGTSATIEFRDSYPPMPPTERGARLLALLSQASIDAGFGPAPRGRSVAPRRRRRPVRGAPYRRHRRPGRSRQRSTYRRRGSRDRVDRAQCDPSAIFIHRLIAAPSTRSQ